MKNRAAFIIKHTNNIPDSYTDSEIMSALQRGSARISIVSTEIIKVPSISPSEPEEAVLKAMLDHFRADLVADIDRRRSVDEVMDRSSEIHEEALEVYDNAKHDLLQILKKYSRI